MIRWAFFTILATGLFYGLYYLLLKRDHWLQVSRWYLLTTLSFSIVYPLLRLPAGLMHRPAEPAVLITMESPTVTVAATGGPVSDVDIAWILYLLGFLLMALMLMVQVGRMLIYLSRHSFENRGPIRLSTPDDDTQPFSFFHWVVIGTRNLTTGELDCVLSHEQLHVRQHHTLDILYMRILCCVAWFNPLSWMMLHELRTVHEYMADNEVLHTHGHRGYLELLYREALGIGYSKITNNFQCINIKNRINMMKKQRSRFGAWKLTAVVPVALWLLMVGCQPAAAQSVSTQKNSQPAAQVQKDRPSSPSTKAKPTPTKAKNQKTVKAGPDVEPQFPGGTAALQQYLADNINYPEQAKAEGIEGRVMVRFTIAEDGAIYNVEVARGIGGGCDEEAVRVVKAMPKWIPTYDDGKAVAVSYVLPISFKLR